MEYAVQMKNISKSFGSINANSNVNIDIYKGEILALLGENGSGKTTLMNILSGIYYPDSGQIFVSGKEVSISSPKEAFNHHIGMIHQHFKLVDVFSAVENTVLGIEDEKFDLKAATKRIEDICGRYGFEVNPQQKVYDMSVSQKQTLEIVKALYRGADVLILDEPTAVLTPQETQRLFNVIRSMKADGKSIVIITHKLNEVMEISDRVAVLRKGHYIGEVETKDTDPQKLTDMMVGRAVSLNIRRTDPVNPVKRLEVNNLSVRNSEGVQVLKNISFTAYGGEILGIAGISGCGQKELLESIAGLQKAESGSSIKYYAPDGSVNEMIGLKPAEIMDMGVHLSFVPEDRLGMGLVGSMGMSDNMMLKSYRNSPGPFTDRSPSKKLAETVKEELEVMTPSINTPVRKLSGGNVQKVLVGREISAVPTVLMTAYAVRGLDINTSYTIYNLLAEQKEQGVAVIYVGEDLDVLIELCDRIIVLCGGELNDVVDARTVSKEEIGYKMTYLTGRGSDPREDKQ
ncbi:MAG: ABC transporter ATP-binding protein [Oscillospiraceae bacterium]|nr:ABC transporter ATP-binding protein [Oscillospiraceae bacterium]